MGRNVVHFKSYAPNKLITYKNMYVIYVKLNLLSGAVHTYII